MAITKITVYMTTEVLLNILRNGFLWRFAIKKAIKTPMPIDVIIDTLLAKSSHQKSLTVISSTSHTSHP